MSGAIDIEAIRRRLATSDGRRFWRSLEEAAGTPELEALLEQDFPRQVAAGRGVDRRQFLRLMSASLALAGLGACTRQPQQEIVPYAKAPEEGVVPGEPLFFATAMPLGGTVYGLLAESHMGRPTKLEGNPEHPLSLGGADVFAQASVLGLYDPDRSQVVRSAGEIRPWSAFLEVLRAAIEAQRPKQGAGIRILTETVTSPTLVDQLIGLGQEFPGLRWHEYEPINRDNASAGVQAALGADAAFVNRLELAEVIVALDADFLGTGPGALRDTRAFSARRRPGGRTAMSRLYVAEPMPTVTGGKADHRIAVRAGDIEPIARALAAGVGAGGVTAPADLGEHAQWVAAALSELKAHHLASVVVAGDAQPPAVHALVHLVNASLGNSGTTIQYVRPFAGGRDQTESLRKLVDEMDAGAVDVLIMLESNPVFTAPADLRFAERLAKVPLRIRLGLYEDETSRLCHWHLPAAHYLESWSDVRGIGGSSTVIQPLIAPLYDGKSAHELLAACLPRPDGTTLTGYDLVRTYWGRQRAGDTTGYWRQALHDGIVPDSEGAALRVDRPVDYVQQIPESVALGEGLEITFRPDPAVYDGRFANNGWLQELPRPMTKLTWDNAACLAPGTAERLGLATGDVVELRLDGRSVRAPIWIVPGHAVEAVTVHFGYGREHAGRVAEGVGFNAYAIRSSTAPWIARGLEIHKTGEHHEFATTQHHHDMEGRDVVRAATIAEYQANPKVIHERGEEAPDISLYPPMPYEGYAWGMAIDLSACTGCNACVIACQAENNIAVVGKDQVGRGREMHWIRVDRYFEGSIDAPEIHHQPVPCMHCENAPCEVVCPVNATVHSSDGLNQMVYNRCVGTKYCSNNCPYKVRRFNFYLYSDWSTESLKLQRNPDVTVRSRGVMEKCTYCVQRIQYAKIKAEEDDRKVRDGEVVPACAQTCPAEAIVFGDLNDPTSRVAKAKAEPRNYALLGELNTRPRTTYLAELRNPNRELKKA
jgi:molybdopterin-containing oxidoreductase family iron-sulfur binding subunit